MPQFEAIPLAQVPGEKLPPTDSPKLAPDAHCDCQSHKAIMAHGIRVWGARHPMRNHYQPIVTLRAHKAIQDYVQRGRLFYLDVGDDIWVVDMGWVHTNTGRLGFKLLGHIHNVHPEAFGAPPKVPKDQRVFDGRVKW